MENKIEFVNGLKVINSVAEKSTWFEGYSNRWPTASLPVAYAMACVEVVCQKSEKAGRIFQQIIEGWGKPGIDEFYKELIAELSNEELEEIKHILSSPDIVFEPDPNEPFSNWEELFNDPALVEEIFKEENACSISEKDMESSKDMVNLLILTLGFIIVGFNRNSDIDKGKYRVFPSEKAPWLILSILYRTAMEARNITLERLRRIYKLKKYKGKIYDLHKIMTEEPMNRIHRRIVANGKAVHLKLKNDRIFMNAARHWYQCRVANSSVNKFLDKESKEGRIWHLKNMEKEIRPCDEALGYRTRRRKAKQDT